MGKYLVELLVVEVHEEITRIMIHIFYTSVIKIGNSDFVQFFDLVPGNILSFEDFNNPIQKSTNCYKKYKLRNLLSDEQKKFLDYLIIKICHTMI